MSGDESAALDTSVDTSDPGDSGAEPAEGLDSTAANDNGGGETPAEKRERLKLKWLGREEEIDDPRKLAERFSDEYEYEFRGPGGKPMKARWPDIERHVQLSAGAQERMKQANAIRQQFQQKIEWAKADNYANLPAVLEQDFGITNPDEFFYQRAADYLQRKAEMAELAVKAETDPTGRYAMEYQRRMEEMYATKHATKQKWAEAQQQRAAQEQQAHQERQAREGMLRNELKAAGVPVNPHTVARAGYIEREQRGLGLELEPRQLAYQLRKELDAEILGHLDSLPPEKLLSYLGEKRRAALRDAELAATKAAKKAQAPAASNGHSNGKKEPSGDDAFSKAMKNMMRGA